jgi:hypothetical protein
VSEWIKLFQNHVKSVNNEYRLLDLPSIWYSGYSWTVPASSDQLGVQPATPMEGNPTTVAAFGVEDIFLSSTLQRIPYVFYWVEDGQEAGQSILTTPAC